MFDFGRRGHSESRLNIRRPTQKKRPPSESSAASPLPPREKPTIKLAPRQHAKPLHPLILIILLILVMIFMAPLWMHGRWSLFDRLFGGRKEPAPAEKRLELKVMPQPAQQPKGTSGNGDTRQPDAETSR